jgi:hypothetical protein
MSAVTNKDTMDDVYIYTVLLRIFETNNLIKNGIKYTMSSIIENEFPAIKNVVLPDTLQKFCEIETKEYSIKGKFKNRTKAKKVYDLLGGDGVIGKGNSSSANDTLNDIEKRYKETNSENKKKYNVKLFSEAFY